VRKLNSTEPGSQSGSLYSPEFPLPDAWVDDTPSLPHPVNETIERVASAMINIDLNCFPVIKFSSFLLKLFI
jgi:hypothetical protein